MYTGAGVSFLDPHNRRSVRTGQKKTRGRESRGEEIRRIYVEKNPRCGETQETGIGIFILKCKGASRWSITRRRPRRSACEARNNTRRETFQCGIREFQAVVLRSFCPIARERKSKGRTRSRQRGGRVEGRRGIKSEAMEMERGW